jgi:hypothetical protein
MIGATSWHVSTRDRQKYCAAEYQLPKYINSGFAPVGCGFVKILPKEIFFCSDVEDGCV